MSLLQFLKHLVMAAKKTAKPAPLPIPAAPVALQKVGREVRLQLPIGYKQEAMEVQQVTRGIPYKRLTDEFGGTHTDADSTVVVPGIGTDYAGEFRLRAAASPTNQAGKELILKNPVPKPPKPTAPTNTTPPVLPIPAAPTLAALQNLDGSFKLPAGTSLDQLEIELT